MKVNVKEVQKLMLKFNKELSQYMEDATIVITGYDLDSKNLSEKEREITQLTLNKNKVKIKDLK